MSIAVPIPYTPEDFQLEEFEVKTFQVQATCKKGTCSGTLKCVGQNPDNPLQQWVHQCGKCGDMYYMSDQYPGIRTERVT